MMKHVFAMTALATATLATIALPTPAMAQGSVSETPAVGQRVCPSGYVAGSNGRSEAICYPNSGAKAVYPHNGADCAAGYVKNNRYWCIASNAKSGSSSSSSGGSVEQRLGTADRLTKPSKGNRCPTGWASTTDLTQCFTMVKNPPTARRSGGKPCAAGEFNDWGVWCTTNYKATTKEQAYGALRVDFNRLYLSGFRNMEPVLSADAIAYYGPETSADSSTSASSSGSSKPAEQTAQCDTSGNGSASGAAVGGAIGGETGAAIGAMLGGFGKKKKKSAGC